MDDLSFNFEDWWEQCPLRELKGELRVVCELLWASLLLRHRGFAITSKTLETMLQFEHHQAHVQLAARAISNPEEFEVGTKPGEVIDLAAWRSRKEMLAVAKDDESE